MTESVLMPGPAGNIEYLIDMPAVAPIGVAVVAHPHPLQGGSANHKVPHQIAKALLTCGYVAVRPNFRGVGRTEGVHDCGAGEADDLVSVIDHVRNLYPGSLLVAGFSFGAYAMARAVAALSVAAIRPDGIILAGMPWGRIAGQRSYEPPPVPLESLIVHGEQDDRVPLAAVFDWARPQGLPVVVVPGAGHFFAGKLATLERLVNGYVRAL
ncbi:alpha/beta hydrolase [Ralstonia pseudosolanacearum]